MRQLKMTMILAASLVLTIFLTLGGCGEDRGHRIHEERVQVIEHRPERREKVVIIEERHDNGRHEDHGGR